MYKRISIFISAIVALLCLGATAPLVPSLAPLPVRTNYVAVRAEYLDTGIYGAWSKEVQITNLATAVLAWDAVPGTRYTLGYSTNSGVYTNLVPAGTNLSARLVVLKTNRVVTVYPVQSATVRGPWSAISNWAPLMLTNSVGDKYYKLVITETNF